MEKKTKSKKFIFLYFYFKQSDYLNNIEQKELKKIAIPYTKETEALN